MHVNFYQQSTLTDCALHKQ